MTAQPPLPDSPQVAAAAPPQRWYRSRKLRYCVILLGIGVAGYFVLPWLLMPNDLRRMQGKWNVVRYLRDGKEEMATAAVFEIAGNRLNVLKLDNEIMGSKSLDCWQDVKELHFRDVNELKILGVKVAVPVFFNPTKDSTSLKYELAEERLTLRSQVGEKHEVFMERK